MIPHSIFCLRSVGRAPPKKIAFRTITPHRPDEADPWRRRAIRNFFTPQRLSFMKKGVGNKKENPLSKAVFGLVSYDKMKAKRALTISLSTPPPQKGLPFNKNKRIKPPPNLDCAASSTLVPTRGQNFKKKLICQGGELRGFQTKLPAPKAGFFFSPKGWF